MICWIDTLVHLNKMLWTKKWIPFVFNENIMKLSYLLYKIVQICQKNVLFDCTSKLNDAPVHRNMHSHNLWISLEKNVLSKLTSFLCAISWWKICFTLVSNILFSLNLFLLIMTNYSFNQFIKKIQLNQN